MLMKDSIPAETNKIVSIHSVLHANKDSMKAKIFEMENIVVNGTRSSRYRIPITQVSMNLEQNKMILNFLIHKGNLSEIIAVLSSLEALIKIKWVCEII